MEISSEKLNLLTHLNIIKKSLCGLAATLSKDEETPQNT